MPPFDERFLTFIRNLCSFGCCSSDDADRFNQRDPEAFEIET